MKQIIMVIACLLLGSIAEAQSIALPARTPIHCSAQSGCAYPYVPSGPMMGILVARAANQGTIADSLGSIWTRDYCNTLSNSGDGDCIFHANFNTTTNLVDTINLPSTGFSDVFLFLYSGNWKFFTGQAGDDSLNYPFSECAVNQACPYSWTLPVEADAGNLLIAWADLNSTGKALPKPGPGWYAEATDNILAIEDQLASVDGVYIGSLTWKTLDGLQDAATCWLMGIAVYARY